jgi:hypothetical protein
MSVRERVWKGVERMTRRLFLKGATATGFVTTLTSFVGASSLAGCSSDEDTDPCSGYGDGGSGYGHKGYGGSGSGYGHKGYGGSGYHCRE